MTTQLAPLTVQHFTDNNGNLLAGGQLYTYAAGTSTPLATYTDSTGGTANANPVIMNARGEANVWTTGGLAYKFVLKDASGVTIWTVDNIADGSLDSALAAALANTTDPTKGSALVGYLPPWSGAIGRTQSEKNNDFISVKDFGAKGDGITDDTVALQAAINFAATESMFGSTVYLPAGKYMISSPLLINKSYIRLVGAGINGAINTPNVGTAIMATASGMDCVILVHSPTSSNGVIYGVYISDLGAGAVNGLASNPHGIYLQDASEIVIERCKGLENLVGALVFDGTDIIQVSHWESSNVSQMGIYFTIANATVFIDNDIAWIKYLNLDTCSTAAIVIDSPARDINVTDSYIEATPVTVLIQVKSGSSGFALQKLTLERVTSWNNSANPYSDTTFITAEAPSSSAAYLRVQNLTVRNCKSYQANGTTDHIQFLQNGNTNGSTAFIGIDIDGGQYWSASRSIVYSDATYTSGNFRGEIKALAGYESGAAIALRYGTGMINATNNETWLTQELGAFTPVDESGAGLVFTSAIGNWTRTDDVVTVFFAVTYPTTSDTHPATLGVLPYPSVNISQYVGGGIIFNNATANVLVAVVNQNSSNIGIRNAAGGSYPTNATLSGQTIKGSVVYKSQ